MKRLIFIFKKQAFVLVMLCCGMSLTAQTIAISQEGIGTITVTTAGQVTTAISTLTNPEKESIVELQISSAATGTLNESDVRQSLVNLTNLKTLDLSGITPTGFDLPHNTLSQDGLSSTITVETVILPSNLRSIGGNFGFKSKLRGTLTLPSSANVLGNLSQYNGLALNCPGITAFAGSGGQFTCVDGVLFSNENQNMIALIRYPGGKTDESYTIPGTVTTLTKNAFHSNTNLKKITFPVSLTRFKENNIGNPGNPADPALQNPDQVFVGMTALEEIEVASGNLRFASVGGGILADILNKKTVYFPSAYNKTDITIEGSLVETISNRLFNNRGTSFQNAEHRVTFTEGVKTIEYDAFRTLPYLTFISLPSTLTAIENHAFNGADRMTTMISFATTPPATSDDSFREMGRLNTLQYRFDVYVPANSLEAYKVAEPSWKKFTAANYKPFYSIAITNGTGSVLSPAVPTIILANDVVSITADEAPEEEAFDHWEISPAVSGGSFVATNSTTTFAMPASNVTVTAVYSPVQPTEIPYTAVNDDPIISTRYYTILGVEVQEPLEKEIYIVKKIHVSQKEEVVKIIYTKIENK